MHIELLLTGNELMSGDTVDSNSAMIAQRFREQGWTIARKITVGDNFEQLVEEIRRQAAKADLLLINGGLGPTVDDLTAAALATACGVALAEHPGALAWLQSWCAQRNIPLNTANRKQAMLPAGCTLVPNPEGSAVGFSMVLDDCLVIATPGVPSELRTMLDTSIMPQLYSHFGASPAVTERMTFFGMGESGIQELINTRWPDWPAEVELGFRVVFPLIELKLTTRSARHNEQRLRCRGWLEQAMQDYLVGPGDATLQSCVVELLRERGQTVALAESCTGGLIAALLTEIPGVSAVFEAGYVTYSNTQKQQVLGVPAALLETHGAVSQAVVEAMARGALAAARSDWVLAVSGIAGPDGGSAAKPVGTVWIAWGNAERLDSACFLYGGGRKMTQSIAAHTAMDLLRRRLLGIESEPRFLRVRRVS